MSKKLQTRIFKIAQACGLNDRQLAEKMGVDSSLVWRVRNGERGIGEAFITGAQRAFPHMDLDDLFYTELVEEQVAI